MQLNRRHLLAAAGAASFVQPAYASQREGRVIYENALASPEDIAGFRLEGSAHVTFPNGHMLMENALPPERGQEANFVHWCPEVFPRDIEVSWQFRPVRGPGLCVFFFGAHGLVGGSKVDLFDERLAPRNGVYGQYTEGDIGYLSISYYRRRWEPERAFHYVNLRSAPGFVMQAQGADPLPTENETGRFYTITMRQKGRRVTFAIEDLTVLDWTAPRGQGLVNAGRIGFRQMAPLRAEYANLVVRELA